MVERKTLAAVVAAGAVAVLVTAAVVVFGIRRLPPFPAVSDAPSLGIPGTIAYVAPGEDERCVTVVAAAGGTPRTLLCTGGGAELGWITQIGWSPQGRVLVRTSDEFGDDVVVVVDPSTAEIVERVVLAPHAPGTLLARPEATTSRADGAEVLVADTDDGNAKLAVRHSDGSTRTIVSVDGPRDYAFVNALWSPGGGWILAEDSDGRLLVVAGDGDPGPRLLLARGEDIPSWAEAGSLAWFVPGDRTYTVDPADLPTRT